MNRDEGTRLSYFKFEGVHASSVRPQGLNIDRLTYSQRRSKYTRYIRSVRFLACVDNKGRRAEIALHATHRRFSFLDVSQIAHASSTRRSVKDA